MPIDYKALKRQFPLKKLTDMTYQEALITKEKLGPIQVFDGDTLMTILVTPSDAQDFLDYTEHFDSSLYTDETARAYCSSGKFTVRALYRLGESVIIEDLERTIGFV